MKERAKKHGVAETTICMEHLLPYDMIKQEKKMIVGCLMKSESVLTEFVQKYKL
jgi:hypothetical protein